LESFWKASFGGYLEAFIVDHLVLLELGPDLVDVLAAVGHLALIPQVGSRNSRRLS
jgi:hypothetical protein